MIYIQHTQFRCILFEKTQADICSAISEYKMMWRPVHKFGLFPFHRNVKYESEAPSQCAGLRSAPDLKPLDVREKFLFS